MTSRIEKLQRRLPELYVDAFLVTNPASIYYLTGFNLPAGDGCLVLTEKQAVLITDARYQLALAAFESREVVGMITRDYYGALDEFLVKQDLMVLGFETSLSYDLFDQLDERMTVDLVPLTNLVEDLRLVKDSGEVAKLEASARLHDAGFDYLLSQIQPGVSEKTLAHRLDFWMKEHGASAAAFAPIVASGPNSALPHATASDRVLEKDDVVLVDFGYVVDGYVADITRTVALGEPDFEFKAVYQIVNEARQAAIAAAKAGQTGAAIDQAGRQVIEAAGYGDEFNHGIGHGIGLAIHEAPASLSPSTSAKLQQNQVVTIEPGIYLPKLFGVRIEDDIRVTHGGATVLTAAPTDLIVL